MNSVDSSESSSSVAEREDGDGASDSERPHKKARFAWQIKGKYHLKNTKNQMKDPIETPTESSESPSQDGSLETAPVELINTNKLDSPVSSNLTLPESPIETSESQKDPVHFTSWTERLVSPEEAQGQPSSSHSNVLRSRRWYYSDKEMDQKREASSRIFGMLYRDNMRRWEYYNAEWQADQIEKSKMDNAINSFLELTRRIDPSVEANHRLTQHIEELRGLNDVVDNAIMMAISAHGLQSSEPEMLIPENIPEEGNDSHTKSNLPISMQKEDLSRDSDEDREPNETLSDETNSEESSDENTALVQSASKCSSDDNLAVSSVLIPSLLDNTPSKCTTENTEQISMPEPYMVTSDDYTADFMNTAVLHAIQSKGLVTTWSGFG